jgi:hypothetical protein
MQPLQLVINNLAPHQNRDIYSSFQAHNVPPLVRTAAAAFNMRDDLPQGESQLHDISQQQMCSVEEVQQHVLTAIEEQLEGLLKQQRAACLQVN